MENVIYALKENGPTVSALKPFANLFLSSFYSLTHTHTCTMTHTYTMKKREN